MGLARSVGVAVVAAGVIAPAVARADVADSTLRAVLGGEVVLERRAGPPAKGVLVGFSADAITLSTARVPRAEVVALRLVSAPPVSEETLRGAVGARVTLRLRNASIVEGKLLAFTADSVTVVSDDSVVHDVPRGELRSLHYRATRRKFGLELGALPSVMADVDAGLFRAYVSTSIFFPAVMSGNVWGFSTGAGVAIPVLASSPALKIDVLAHLNLMGVSSACSACDYPTAHTFAFGLAVGVHTTLDSGFTFGLMLPVIGWSATPGYHGSSETGVSYYFISSAVSMAIGYLGYRF